MVFTASRILDLLIIYYGQWKNKLWSHHYKIMNSLQQSVNTSEYGNIMNSVSEHIRKEKGTLNKTHSSKLQRDLNNNKKYLPNDYMVPPLPATTKNINIPENTNRKRKKKSRIPTFKHKRLKIKAKDCLDKSKLTIEAMEKSVINISGKQLTKHHLYAFYLGGSFAPTPKLPNLMKFNDDLQSWFNKLRYKYNYSRFSDKINHSGDNQMSAAVTKEIKKYGKMLNKVPT